MQTTITAPRERFRDFRWLNTNRTEWQRVFAQRMLDDPCTKGHLLDIGAGADANALDPFREVLRNAERVDGVDPDPAVAENPFLTEHWVGLLEEVEEIPEGVYDGAVCFFVAEHVARPDRFLGAVYRALRPGGAFYIVTPHAHHPFPVCVRLIEALRFKRWFAAHGPAASVNDYPAHYRLNSRRAIEPCARRVGFSAAAFEYYPCVHWDTYFPRPLRFIPHMYDRLIGIRTPALAQLMLVRLEKGAEGA